MLRSRIIPVLLVRDKGLTKTVKFKSGKYIGDPINAVKIFNEKEVDELMVLDIDATVERREPDYTMIEHLAAECRMPLCYGGGVSNSDQIQKIVQLGVEKVAISSAAIENPDFITEAARHVGNQSVVVVLDVKKSFISGEYKVWTHNGRLATGKNLLTLMPQMEEAGAGEIILNAIDNDGMMKGYDLNLIEKIRDVVSVPLTVLGGAGSLNDISQLVKKHGVIGAAAGSLFIFKGAYKAVLINYPNRVEKDSLIGEEVVFKS